jgi:hypothetical protein
MRGNQQYIYEAESVNMSQMDIKRKTRDIRTWKKKTFTSLHILHQQSYLCPIALPVGRNPQHRSLSHLLTSVSTSSSSENRLPPSCEPLYATNTSTVNIPLLISFALSPFTHKKKTHNRTLLFGSILLRHGRHFDYWNLPMNMRMRVCYLDCHEAGLQCYLVIHIKNLLSPLPLFYFHLWLTRAERCSPVTEILLYILEVMN